MNLSEEMIGQLVSLKNSNSEILPGRLTAKILKFTKGPIHTDVDLELPTGEILNTFDSNLEKADLIEIAKYRFIKALNDTF